MTLRSLLANAARSFSDWLERKDDFPPVREAVDDDFDKAVIHSGPYRLPPNYGNALFDAQGEQINDEKIRQEQLREAHGVVQEVLNTLPLPPPISNCELAKPTGGYFAVGEDAVNALRKAAPLLGNCELAKTPGIKTHSVTRRKLASVKKK